MGQIRGDETRGEGKTRWLKAGDLRDQLNLVVLLLVWSFPAPAAAFSLIPSHSVHRFILDSSVDSFRARLLPSVGSLRLANKHSSFLMSVDKDDGEGEARGGKKKVEGIESELGIPLGDLKVDTALCRRVCFAMRGADMASGGGRRRWRM